MAHIVLIALAGLTYLLVLGPIVIVLITAFSPTDFFVFPPPGLSLRWFTAFFNTDSLRSAFSRSIQIALTSALLATILGSMAALFVARRKGFLASLLQTLFLAPLIFPAIVLGLALLLFFKLIGGMPEFVGLVLAHSILGMPFVIRAVSASLLAVDPVLEEASQSLRAGPLRTFRLITLPLIWPGISVRGDVRLHPVLRGAQHCAVPDWTWSYDLADRNLQLFAIPGRAACDRCSLRGAGGDDRCDGGCSGTDRRPEQSGAVKLVPFGLMRLL